MQPFFAAHQVGMKIMILTGRESLATTRRMTELKVDYLYQNVKNKVEFLKLFMEKEGIQKDEIGQIGDDLNDLPPMMLVGYVVCRVDSCPEVKEIADYASNVNGGHGAVRDISEHFLRETG